MGKTYDIIIVGAGSAGCVLANRLSRDPAVQVLLLEAGGWDWNPLISVPVGARKMFQYGMYQWGDVSEANPNANDQRMIIPHGKVIGGTSSINFMAHARGHPVDYERWVASGATGWSYKEVLPFFKESECWEGGEDEWRGDRGELGVSMPRLVDPIAEAWLESARSLGYGITQDFNGQNPEGFGVIQYSMRNGRRSSAARGFLHPALKRPNLTIRTRSFVTKVLIEGGRAVGVEYVRKGREQVARGGERIVLSLGAINTPQLLMLSGVGPADHLKSVGIVPIVDLPVGKHLEDHLAFPMQWKRKTPDPFHLSLRFDKIAVNMCRAYLLRNGPAAKLPGAIMAMVKSDLSLRQPDLQVLIPVMDPEADVWFPGINRPKTGSFGIKVNLLSQKSRGEIMLRSADPRERPRVFYNSLSCPEDGHTLRHGFRIAETLANNGLMEAFNAGQIAPPRRLRTDDEIDGYIRGTATQQFHPACTCKIGTVLEPDLRVRGLEGLHVVDAAAMPNLVSSNPNAVVMMMAARVAAMWAQ